MAEVACRSIRGDVKLDLISQCAWSCRHQSGAGYSDTAFVGQATVWRVKIWLLWAGGFAEDLKLEENVEANFSATGKFDYGIGNQDELILPLKALKTGRK